MYTYVIFSLTILLSEYVTAFALVGLWEHVWGFSTLEPLYNAALTNNDQKFFLMGFCMGVCLS